MPTAKTARLGQPLSTREKQIIHAIADGLTNKQAGELLSLAPLTIKSSLARIGRKLGTGDRAGIVATALRSRQITLEPLGTLRRGLVICQCARCQHQLATGTGMAARLCLLRLPAPRQAA